MEERKMITRAKILITIAEKVLNELTDPATPNWFNVRLAVLNREELSKPADVARMQRWDLEAKMLSLIIPVIQTLSQSNEQKQRVAGYTPSC